LVTKIGCKYEIPVKNMSQKTKMIVKIKNLPKIKSLEVSDLSSPFNSVMITVDKMMLILVDVGFLFCTSWMILWRFG